MVTDIQVIVNQMRQQLLALERQLFYLQQRAVQATPPGTAPVPFSELCGIWRGVVINEQDFEAARLKMSNDI